MKWDRELVEQADIIIPSCLPTDKRIREARIKYHQRQLGELFNRQFMTCSILSGWKKSEIKDVFGKVFPYIYLGEKRIPKYKKHNLALTILYDSRSLMTKLFLDDDVVPRNEKETDAENGIVNCAAVVGDWVTYPYQMPGHVCFFAAQGLMFDAYYKSNPVILGPATPQVVGWAMMVRSDCGVLWDGKIMKFVEGRRYTSDDTAFRLHCEDQGKIVLKHNRAFFKTFQPKADTTSTYANGQEDRRPIIKADMALLRQMYPNLFSSKKKSKQSSESEGGGLFSKS